MPQDNKIKIRRGLDANLPAFNTEIGELRYSTDTKKLYIDDGTANIYIAGDVNDFPISTATQNALNLKADKGLNIKITTPSAWVTGTAADTEVLRIEIPANSISDNSFLNMPILFFSKIGTNGAMHIKGKLSTSPTMPTGTTDVIFGFTNLNATNLSLGMDRTYIISEGLIKGFPFNLSPVSSSAAGTVSFASKPFDRTVTNYLYVSIALANSADKARLEGLQLTNS